MGKENNMFLNDNSGFPNKPFSDPEGQGWHLHANENDFFSFTFTVIP